MFAKCNINNIEVSLYAFIYSYYEKIAQCQFSYLELATLLGTSKRTVIRTIKKLQQKNLISVEKKILENGEIAINTYSIREGGDSKC